jgi:hypothetical protein
MRKGLPACSTGRAWAKCCICARIRKSSSRNRWATRGKSDRLVTAGNQGERSHSRCCSTHGSGASGPESPVRFAFIAPLITM